MKIAKKQLKALRTKITLMGLGVDVIAPMEDSSFKDFCDGNSPTFKSAFFKLHRPGDNPDVVVLSARDDVIENIGGFSRIIILI